MYTNLLSHSFILRQFDYSEHHKINFPNDRNENEMSLGLTTFTIIILLVLL